MKTLLLLLTLVPLITFSQLIPELPQNTDGEMFVTETVQLPASNKTTLYLNARQYFVDAHTSANEAIQMDDKESGIIICKGTAPVDFHLGMAYENFLLAYTLKIKVAEGTYTYEMYNFYLIDVGMGSFHEEEISQYFDKSNYFKKNGKTKSYHEAFKTSMLQAIDNVKANITKAMKK